VKDAALWDIRTHFIPHRKHITSTLQSPVSEGCVSFEDFASMTMKDAALWDIKTHFVPHRRHITSALQSPAG
jgi:hypothetical protein